MLVQAIHAMIRQSLQTVSLIAALVVGGGGVAAAQRLVSDLPKTNYPHTSALASPPDWSDLSGYGNTRSAAEIRFVLGHIFSEPGRGWEPWLKVTNDADGAAVLEVIADAGAPDRRKLIIPLADEMKRDSVPRYWRTPLQLGALKSVSQPLAGSRIAIDPGHMGGAYAKMEARWFQIGKAAPVMEGEMTLIVAKLLKSRLEALGAEVQLVRARNAPVTRVRPKDIEKLATRMFVAQGVERPAPAVLKSLTERLFCVAAEIRARGEIVNDLMKPDLVVALHFNAEAWGNPAKPELVEANHFHILTNGCYAPSEIALNDQRLELLHKLFQGSAEEEIAMSTAVAKRFVSANPLPAYAYNKPIARRVNGNPYVWARNLLANRIYQCPVIYMEPHVMNNVETFARVQAGVYAGKREILGKEVENIFAEYADAVALGLADYFRAKRSWEDD